MYVCCSPLSWRCSSKSLLLASVLVLPVFLAGYKEVWAIDECGVAVIGDTITCNGDGTPAGDTTPYANGISYTAGGLTLNIEGGVATINSATRDGVRYRNFGDNSDVALNVASGVDIFVSGLRRGGVYASVNGEGNLEVISAADISVSGNSQLLNGGAAIFASNLRSNTNGIVSINVTGGDLLTSGENSRGIFGYQQAGDISILSGANISTTGNFAHGILGWSFQTNGAVSNIEVEASSGTIITTGDRSHGILALNRADAGSVRITSGADITVLGNDVDGIRVQGGGTIYNFITSAAKNIPYAVTLTGGTVIGGGGMGAGVHVVSIGNGTIDIAAGVTVDGSASGIALRDGDRDGGAAFEIGDGVDEIGGNVVVTTAGTIIGKSILGVGDDIFNLTGGVHNGDIFGDDEVASANDGNDGFNWSGGDLNSGFFGQNGSDTAIISAAANYEGSETLDGGDDHSTADGWVDALTLRNIFASAPGTNIINWEEIIIDGGALSITDGALTAGDGTINTGLTVTNSGVFDGGNALAFTGNLLLVSTGVLNVTGGGVGVFSVSGAVANNGVISSRDGAAGDVLTIAGNYTGGGLINIDTALGDSTSSTDMIVIGGDSSGTTVVNVGNAGGAGAKTGAGPTDGIRVIEVAGTSTGSFVLGSSATAGAYNYSLVQADGQNWFLQSQLQRHIYAYSLIESALRDEIDYFWQRKGQGRELLNRDGSTSFSGSGFWFRSSYSDSQGEATTSISGQSATTNFHSVKLLNRLGYEHKIKEMPNGYLSAGLFGHFRHFTLDVDDSTGSNIAKVTADGYGAGASLSWNSTQGFYGDLVGQFTSYKVDVNAAGGIKGSFDGLTYSLSGEAGYRFDMDGSVRLVPQGQLVWRGSRFQNLTDSSTLEINWKEKSVVTGRLGLALEGGNPVSRGGNGFTAYLIANLLHNFGDGGRLRASGLETVSKQRRTWGELRVGVNLISPDNGFTLFTEAGFSHTFDSKKYSGFRGVAGFNYNF